MDWGDYLFIAVGINIVWLMVLDRRVSKLEKS
jgi:hypothetical protein